MPLTKSTARERYLTIAEVDVHSAPKETKYLQMRRLPYDKPNVIHFENLLEDYSRKFIESAKNV